MESKTSLLSYLKPSLPAVTESGHASPYLSRKFRVPLGVSRGGSAPFCWRSRNQEVPCESLVPFFSQERNCQCGRHEPTKAKTFLKLWFETDCRYSILASALKQHFCKKRNFPCGLVPCAETEILQHTIARNRVQVQPAILPASPLGPMVRA